MSQPNSFDCHHADERRPARRSPIPAVLVGIGILGLLAIAGGIGYLGWRGAQNRADRVELRRLRDEIETQTILVERTAWNKATQKAEGNDLLVGLWQAKEAVRLTWRLAVKEIGEEEFEQQMEELKEEAEDRKLAYIEEVMRTDLISQGQSNWISLLKAKYNALVDQHPEWGEAKYK